MKVCIINQGLRHEKRYQIMQRDSYGFTHVFPGKLFTLEEAQAECQKRGFEVVAVGDIWQCSKTNEQYERMLKAYAEYTKEWSDTHRGAEYEGMSPASFEEWSENEWLEIDE